MRVILCGKNDAAVHALDHMLENGDDVWIVGTHGDDGEDGWQRSLVGAAREKGVDLVQPKKINAPEFIDQLKGYGADLLISIQYDQILHEPLFSLIGCPCLNLHFSLLPRNRGVAPIAWAILEGDRETGATLHHMVEDIDAGNIIEQEPVPIADDETGRSLYDKVTLGAAELFRKCHPFDAELLAKRIEQDASKATYHRAGTFDFSKRVVDWHRPAGDLHRWIRAMIFPPLQNPEFTADGRRFLITDVDGAIVPTDAAPGTVVDASMDGVMVAAKGGAIRIRGLADAADLSVPSAELAPALAVGSVLPSGSGE